MEYKRVRETEHNPGFVYMVFEYMDHDLTGILGSPSSFSTTRT